MTKEEFWSIFQYTHHNRKEIEASAFCGCLFCLNIYSSQEIIAEDDWIPDDGEETATCPRCYVDEMLGDASGYSITDDFLEDLHLFSFPEFDIEWTRAKYKKR